MWFMTFKRTYSILKCDVQEKMYTCIDMVHLYIVFVVFINKANAILCRCVLKYNVESEGFRIM